VCGLHSNLQVFVGKPAPAFRPFGTARLLRPVLTPGCLAEVEFRKGHPVSRQQVTAVASLGISESGLAG